MQDRTHELLEFLDRSGVYLYTLLARLTLRQDIAEDLMQELFIKLSNSRSFEKAKNPIAFARRAAINLAFDWWKKRRRETQLYNDILNLKKNSNSPLNKVIQAEEMEKVLSGINQLKGTYREAFVMRHIQQESFRDIAEQLGKNEHYTRTLCHRALCNLRQILESRSFEKEVSDG